MREKRVFVASKSAVQNHARILQSVKVAGLRRQIGASQAQIVQGRDVASNRVWINILNVELRKERV